MRRGLADSRSHAQRLIADQVFTVDGRIAPKQTMLVTRSTAIEITGQSHPFVGRGGLKLSYALQHFRVPVEGRSAVDIGSSTGGFTDCLLQSGAARVAAIDVGRGQLAKRLRHDNRVTVFESTNVRDVDPLQVGGLFDLVVCDVSFISFGVIAHVIEQLGNAKADWLLLVKPQFEVGKGNLGSGGVVRDRLLHAPAVMGVIEVFVSHGLVTIGITASPIEGAKGNAEYLLHLRRAEFCTDTPVVSEETVRSVSA